MPPTPATTFVCGEARGETRRGRGGGREEVAHKDGRDGGHPHRREGGEAVHPGRLVVAEAHERAEAVERAWRHAGGAG